MIKECKYIKVNCSWDDEIEIKSESVESTNSPKIYDLRTPEKKSRITEMVYEVTSDKPFDTSKDYNYMDNTRILDSNPIKPTTSTTQVSFPFSKHTDVPLVDLILLEVSSHDKHSKTGTVIKLKTAKKN